MIDKVYPDNLYNRFETNNEQNCDANNQQAAGITTTATLGQETTADVADFAQPKAATNLVESVSYGWIDFTNFVKGITKGVFYGTLYGTSAVGINFLLNKGKVSTMGKWVGGFAAGSALLYNMLVAKIMANKEKSEIDHILRLNHNK